MMKPQRAAPSRPVSGEYAPYYGAYVAVVPEGDIVDILEAQVGEMSGLLAGRSDRDGEFRYAPGKWSVKEVLGHVMDIERVEAYRVLRISRKDKTPLPGVEQDDYVRYGPYARCRLADLVEEFTHLRRTSVAMLRALDEKAWLRRGVANNHEVSVRALAYVMAGHARHHMRILEQKYFPALPRP